MLSDLRRWMRQPVSRRVMRQLVWLALVSLVVETALLGYTAFWVMP